MLMNLLKQGAKTDDEYRKKLQRNIKKNIILCVLGLVPIIVGALYVTRGGDMQAGFIAGLFTGTGVVVIFFCVKDIFKARKLLRDGKKLHEERLKASDERNHMIAEKSMYWAGIVTMAVCYAALLISGFFDLTVLWTIWCIMMFYFIVTIILKKYLEKKL